MGKSLRSHYHQALTAVLAATRRQKRLTQRQLAEKMNVDKSYVARVEVGERRLDVAEFIVWAKALKVDPEVLLGRVVRW